MLIYFNLYKNSYVFRLIIEICFMLGLIIVMKILFKGNFKVINFFLMCVSFDLFVINNVINNVLDCINLLLDISFCYVIELFILNITIYILYCRYFNNLVNE